MKELIRAASLILALTLALVLINVYLNNKGSSAGGQGTITVYNWGDYIDPDLIKQFEKETGIKVIYETFDSNEAMMAKIEQGGTSYDITMPSDYMVEMMAERDLLLPLDKSKLPNLKHIDPDFLDLPFDPDNRYSVPYFWGTVGIAFNPSLLDGQTFESWDDLWDPSLKQQIILVDSARETIGFALNSFGYSLNSTDLNELQQAKEKLDKLAPNVKAIIGDEVTQLMIQNEAAVAVTWSGQTRDMMWENEDIDYVVPKEGSNLWFDNMVIPRTAKNIEGAHKFINFMLDPEVAAQNAEYIGYSTPNVTALQYMDPEMVEDERFYPNKDIRDRLEVYKDLGLEMLGLYNDLFLEFKIGQK